MLNNKTIVYKSQIMPMRKKSFEKQIYPLYIYNTYVIKLYNQMNHIFYPCVVYQILKPSHKIQR